MGITRIYTPFEVSSGFWKSRESKCLFELLGFPLFGLGITWFIIIIVIILWLIVNNQIFWCHGFPRINQRPPLCNIIPRSGIQILVNKLWNKYYIGFLLGNFIPCLFIFIIRSMDYSLSGALDIWWRWSETAFLSKLCSLIREYWNRSSNDPERTRSSVS